MIVGRPLRVMFVHKVRELGVLRLLSVQVEVVTDLIHAQGDPMYPRLVAVVCDAHERGWVRRDDFEQRVFSDHFVVIYGRSPSVVVDDVETFVDLEHGL